MLYNRQQRGLDSDDGASTRPAAHLAAAADELDALLDAPQSDMLAGCRDRRHFRRIETTPPVAHLQIHGRSPTLQSQVGMGRACMLAHIGERLYGDAEQGRFNSRRQVCCAQSRGIGDGPAISPQGLDVQAQCRRQPHTLQGSRAHTGDEPPHLFGRQLRQLDGLLQIPASLG